jgi:hypothetical protein
MSFNKTNKIFITVMDRYGVRDLLVAIVEKKAFRGNCLFR